MKIAPHFSDVQPFRKWPRCTLQMPLALFRYLPSSFSSFNSYRSRHVPQARPRGVCACVLVTELDMWERNRETKWDVKETEGGKAGSRWRVCGLYCEDWSMKSIYVWGEVKLHWAAVFHLQELTPPHLRRGEWRKGWQKVKGGDWWATRGQAGDGGREVKGGPKWWEHFSSEHVSICICKTVLKLFGLMKNTMKMVPKITSFHADNRGCQLCSLCHSILFHTTCNGWFILLHWVDAVNLMWRKTTSYKIAVTRDQNYLAPDHHLWVQVQNVLLHLALSEETLYIVAWIGAAIKIKKKNGASLIEMLKVMSCYVILFAEFYSFIMAPICKERSHVFIQGRNNVGEKFRPSDGASFLNPLRLDSHLSFVISSACINPAAFSANAKKGIGEGGGGAYVFDICVITVHLHLQEVAAGFNVILTNNVGEKL